MGIVIRVGWRNVIRCGDSKRDEPKGKDEKGLGFLQKLTNWLTINNQPESDSILREVIQ